MTGKTLGQIAYEGYGERADGVSLVSGEPLPGWDDLSPVIAEAWEAAAQAVVSAGRGEETEVR